MKIQGYDGGKRDQDSFTITRRDKSKLTFLLTALPIGITEEIEKEIPVPRPPRDGFCRDQKRRFIRDSRGRPVPFYDEYDTEYMQKMKKVNRLQTIATIYKSLENDTSIEWETKREAYKAPVEFYLALHEEIKSFGISTGEIADMMEFVMKLSRLGNEEIEEAREDFLD